MGTKSGRAHKREHYARQGK